MHSATLFTTALAGATTVFAGDILWDGRFTSTTASDLTKWSFSNAVGAYPVSYTHLTLPTKRIV